MSTVICAGGRRDWYRPVLVEEEEIYTSPQEGNSIQTRHRSFGPYDLAEHLRSLPAPYNDPSLVVVFGIDAHSLPYNLSAVKCPKVAILGDSHHGDSPLTGPLTHFLSEKYDLVVHQFCRQHVHFFREAGINSCWIPCWELSPVEIAPRSDTGGVCFMGQVGPHHIYRQHVLRELGRRGVEVLIGGGSKRDCANIYNASRVSLNVSLNGDLNLRCFEVMAAGGHLVTDLLSDESGYEIALSGHHEDYSDIDNLLYVIKDELDPAGTNFSNGNGHNHYLRQHRPEHKRVDLRFALAGHPTWPIEEGRCRLAPRQLPDLMKSLARYQFLSELHRQQVAPFDIQATSEREAADFIDLPRLRVHVKADGTDTLKTAGLVDRVTWITP